MSGGLPKPIEDAVKAEEWREQALARAVRPFPPPEPESPLDGAAGFKARMAAQWQQEEERAARVNRLMHERPELLVEPDPLRDFASWQWARKGRTRLWP